MVYSIQPNSHLREGMTTMARRLALVILSAAALAAGGLATHNAVGAARQHAFALTRLTASISSGVRAVAFSPHGQLLASAYSDGDIGLWNLATGHLRGPVLRAGSGGQAVNAVAFSPDGQLLASAYGDGTIRLWNLATGHLRGPVLRAGSRGQAVKAAALRPNGPLPEGGGAHGAHQ